MKSVVFYSFKGGVGRTQSMLNIAKYLSRTYNKKIAILDFDIYAPGISYLAKFDKPRTDKSFLLDYLLNTFKGVKSEFYYEELEKNLFVFPSFHIKNLKTNHKLLTEFSQYLYPIKKNAEDRKNNVSTATDNIFRLLIKDLKNMQIDFDYIFLDARTGITEVSDILFSNFVDLKVIVSSYNEQNIKGSNDVLDLLSEQTGDKHNILRILSPKPDNEDEGLYNDIYLNADLDSDSDLKDKFNWHGTHEISYEKEVVSNDKNLWDQLNSESKYKKEITSISNIINDLLYPSGISDIIDLDKHK